MTIPASRSRWCLPTERSRACCLTLVYPKGANACPACLSNQGVLSIQIPPGEIDSHFGAAKVLTPAGQPAAVQNAPRFVELGSSFDPDTTNKKGPSCEDPSLFGAPGEIRTPDQVVRSHLLYPAELRVRAGREYIEVVRDGHPKNSRRLLTPPPRPAPPHSPDWPSAERPAGSSGPNRARRPAQVQAAGRPVCGWPAGRR